MNERKYISVSEYAELKGITKQAVYKQLNNQLKPFLIVVEKKKYILLEALSEVEKERLNEVKQPIEQPFNNLFQPFLEKQIEEKDKQIESLLRQIDLLQEQNGKLTELLNNSQYLLAAEKQILLNEKNPEPIEAEQPPRERKGLFSRFKKRGNKT
jgi:hypothetical protein